MQRTPAEFYEKAFGAKSRGVMKGLDGKVMHAELKIGDSIIMLSDEFPDFGALSPQSLKGSPAGLHIYVEDVDAAFDQSGPAPRSTRLSWINSGVIATVGLRIPMATNGPWRRT
jgi:uncharacterized glyoxalase superfamily protein PhnB